MTNLIVFIELGRPTWIKALIVKLKSWKSCQHFYNPKPNHFNSAKIEPGQNLFSESIDSAEAAVQGNS